MLIICAPLHAAPKKKKRPAAIAPVSAAKSAPDKPMPIPPAPLLLAVFNDEQFLRINGVDDLGEDRIRLRLHGGGTLEISTANLKEIVYEEPALRPENEPVPKSDSEALPPFAVPPQLEPLIRAAAKAAGLDYALVVSLIKVESNFNPAALSHKGAQGLMQLMPGTASQLGVPNAFDPEANVEGGAKYLRELLERYNFDLVKALAAYNAGPHRVEQFGGVPPYYETRAYVARVVRDFNKKKIAQKKSAATSHQNSAPQRSALTQAKASSQTVQ